MQGGATAQFTAVCQNFLDTEDQADYILTGAWSKKAYLEGKVYCDAHIAAQVRFPQPPPPPPTLTPPRGLVTGREGGGDWHLSVVM